MNPIQAAISKISNVARQKFGDNQGWVQNNRISTQPLRQAFATPTDTAYTISRVFLADKITGNPLTRQQYHQAAQPIKQAYTKLPRPIQKLGEGFYEGSTVGLSNLDIQPSNNITEKLAYGVGYGASILNPLNPMNKIAIGLKGTAAIRGTQQLLGKGASRLIAKGGASKILGLGVKGASQGLPYTTAYGALNLATRKPEEAGVGALTDVGIDAAFGAIPVVGALAMKGRKTTGNLVSKFKNIDDYVNAKKPLPGTLMNDNDLRKMITKAKADLDVYLSRGDQHSADQISGYIAKREQLLTDRLRLKQEWLRLKQEWMNKTSQGRGYTGESPTTLPSRIKENKSTSSVVAGLNDPSGSTILKTSSPFPPVAQPLKSNQNTLSSNRSSFLKSFPMNKNQINNHANDILPKYLSVVKHSEPTFINTTEQIAKAVDGQFVYRMKSPDSIVVKMNRRPESFTLGNIDDTLGSTVLTEHTQQAIDHARKNFDIVKIDDFRDSPTWLGYRAVHMDYQLPNGQIGEIQIHTPQSLVQKTYAHDIYEKWRPFIEEAQGSYEEAYKAVPMEKKNAFVQDVDLSRSIFEGRAEIPQKYYDAVDKQLSETRDLINGLALQKNSGGMIPPEIQSFQLKPLAKKADEIIGDYQMSKEMYDSAKLAVDADRRVLAKDGKIRAFTQPDVKKLSASSQIESIIQEGRKSIGKPAEKSVKSIKQFADNLYTQMVDRYHPISLASKKAKKQLEVKGAVLRPEHDPEVLVRRLTGAGSIADTQYRRELKPIIDKLDQFGISKDDMDVYLAHKRIAGFGDVGREIYGADPVKSQSIINAIEAKYGEPVKSVADELYLYQDKALKELADSGFLSPEALQVIKSQNPNYAPLYRVMDEMDNYLGVPTRKTMQGASPIEKIKGSDRQIISPVESIIANTFRNRAAIEKNRVAQSIIRLQEIAPELGFKKVNKSASDTITIWDKGKKEFWEVGEEIASTAKGLNEENMNTLLKIFTAPASLLRQGATGRNPEFMIPNIIRDQLDASITSKYGYIPFVDYLSGLKSMISNDEVFKRWERSGAKIDLGEMSGRKSIQASFDTVKKKRGLFSWLGGMLDTMGKYSEQPTRVGLFKKAYQKTGNELLSMMESRDATVDFARMGTKMKVANSVIPFLNVGVQGFDKLIRATKNNPSKVLALASFYGILPSVSSTLYNVMYHPQEFAEVPQYEKDANFVFIKGRNKNGTVDYFTIPKGNVIPLIANPTEHFISYMAETDSDSFSKFAVKFLSSALPIVGDGSTVKEVAIKTIGSNLPQLIKPATEALLNRSFYKYDANKEEAKEIVPYYLKSKPGYKQDYEFTPKMYKAIGAVLNVSPLLIKNTMEGYLAGYAKIPAQIIQIMSDISDGKQTNPNDITLLRRFMKQTYDTGTPKKNTKLPVPPLLDRISGSVEASETGSSLYYSIKNTKRLTPEMKEDLLKESPTPKTKGKTKTTSAKTKVKKVKASKSKKAKVKKIKTPKLSAKLPKRKKIKIAKIKINKFKSLQSPKYAKVKTRSSKNLT